MMFLRNTGKHEAARDLEHGLQCKEENECRRNPADLEVDIEDESL